MYQNMHFLNFHVKMYYVPILTSLWTIMAFFITYILGLCQGHLESWFPSASYLGTVPPEKGIFTFMMNISSLGFILTGYIRNKQVDLQLSLLEPPNFCCELLNTINFWLAVMAGISLNIFGVFSVEENHTIHCFAEFSYFMFSWFLCLGQTKLAGELVPIFSKLDGDNANKVYWLRLLLCAIASFTGPIYGVLGYLRLIEHVDDYMVLEICMQWVTIFNVAIYNFLYGYDFNFFKLDEFKIQYKMEKLPV